MLSRLSLPKVIPSLEMRDKKNLEKSSKKFLSLSSQRGKQVKVIVKKLKITKNYK